MGIENKEPQYPSQEEMVRREKMAKFENKLEDFIEAMGKDGLTKEEMIKVFESKGFSFKKNES